MSDFDQNRQSPGQLGGAVRSLAALSAVLLACSVLAAKFLGAMVDSGFSQVAADFSASALARKGAWTNIDSGATGSIRRNGASGGVKTRGEAAK